MNAIFTRKSIRKYKGSKLSEAQIEYLLKAAMQAPSAANQQPWVFVVIDDREVLSAIAAFNPYAQMLNTASHAIVVCGDTSNEKAKGFWVQDCSAATENILLAAEDEGLGAVWIGTYPNEERVEKLSALLQLPKHIVPLSIVSVGEPDESRTAQNRYDATRVYRNSYK